MSASEPKLNRSATGNIHYNQACHYRPCGNESEVRFLTCAQNNLTQRKAGQIMRYAIVKGKNYYGSFQEMFSAIGLSDSEFLH